MSYIKTNKAMLLTVGILFSSISLAQDSERSSRNGGLLIEKNNYPGFTLAEAVRSETCKVYSNRVVITKRYGAEPGKSFTTKEVVRVKASRGLLDVVELSSREELTTEPNFICDAPGTNIVAYQRGESFTLFNNGGCGGDRESRNGLMSQMLIDLVDQYCPLTNDFGAGLGNDLPEEPSPIDDTPIESEPLER